MHCLAKKAPCSVKWKSPCPARALSLSKDHPGGSVAIVPQRRENSSLLQREEAESGGKFLELKTTTHF